MRQVTAALVAAFIGYGISTGLAVAAPPAVDLLPHKAVYELTLGDLHGSGSVVQATGQFEYKWTDVCDGWAVSQKFRIALLYEDGISVSYGWSLSSWESKDGKRYRFFIKRYDGEGHTEAVSGHAEVGPDGGRAVFEEPQAREVALPAGTLFPTEHTLRVLAQAKSSKAPLWTLVFDGSGDRGLFGVSAALSRGLSGHAPPPLGSQLLEGVPSWWVDLAFYGAEAENVEPDQEQSLRLFANGVIDEMRLNYGEFVLNADLTELTPLPAPHC